MCSFNIHISRFGFFYISFVLYFYCLLSSSRSFISLKKVYTGNLIIYRYIRDDKYDDYDAWEFLLLFLFFFKNNLFFFCSHIFTFCIDAKTIIFLLSIFSNRCIGKKCFNAFVHVYEFRSYWKSTKYFVNNR